MSDEGAKPQTSKDRQGAGKPAGRSVLKKQIDRFYQEIADPSRRLAIATYEGDSDHALAAIKGGADVNVVHPDSGLPIIHLAAGGGHTHLVQSLIASGQCDLTIRDPMGRLPSDCAAYSAKDMALAELLAEEEGRQFSQTGKDPRRSGQG